MRAPRLAACVLLSLLPAPVWAGVDVCAIFRSAHLGLGTCCNHGNWAIADLLYAKGRVEVLEQYLAWKKAQREAADTPFEILVGGAARLQVGQQDTLSIIGDAPCPGGFPALVRLVDVLASGQIMSFCTVFRRAEYPGEAVQNLSCEPWGEASQSDLEFFRGRRVTVYRVGDLEVVYESEGLSYELDGARLEAVPHGFLPLRVGERYLLGSPSHALVFEAGRVVAELPFSAEECLRSDSRVEVETHPEWVKLRCENVVLLTYLVAENRFVAGESESLAPALDELELLGAETREIG